MKLEPTDDLSLIDLMADIDKVLTRHHATTLDCLVAGRQLILSGYSQTLEDSPRVDAYRLAFDISQQLLRAMHQRIGAPPLPVGEA